MTKLDMNTAIMIDNNLKRPNKWKEYESTREHKLKQVSNNYNQVILDMFLKESIELEKLIRRYDSRYKTYCQWAYIFEGKKVYYVISEPIYNQLQAVFTDLYAILFDNSSGSNRGKHKKMPLNKILSNNESTRLAELNKNYDFIKTMQQLLEGHPYEISLNVMVNDLKETWDSFIKDKRESVDLARTYYAHPATSEESIIFFQNKFEEKFEFNDQDHRKMAEFLHKFTRLRNIYTHNNDMHHEVLNLGDLNIYLNDKYQK